MTHAKRTNKQIEADVVFIKQAAKTAKTLKELAELSGLTVQQVRVSLDKHPIIKKRVLASLEENSLAAKSSVSEPSEEVSLEKVPVPTKLELPAEDEEGKWVVVCDCPALLYGLESCYATRIVVPKFVYNTLLKIAQFQTTEAKLASAVLFRIHSTTDWCTIVPETEDELLIEPSTESGWRAKKIVSLACRYWCEGYNVTVKTRTGEIDRLAKIQEVLTVDFVETDEDRKVKLAEIIKIS